MPKIFFLEIVMQKKILRVIYNDDSPGEVCRFIALMSFQTMMFVVKL